MVACVECHSVLFDTDSNAYGFDVGQSHRGNC
jgi:hypothetical protein